MIDVRCEVRVEPLDRLRKGYSVAMIRASNRAAKPVRAAVETGAGRIARYGFTAKSIGTVSRYYKDRESVVAVVGPKMSYVRTKGTYTRGPQRGQKRRHRPYLYSWIVEKGSVRTRPKPFLRPAFDGPGQQFPARLAAEMEIETAKLLDGR